MPPRAHRWLGSANARVASVFAVVRLRVVLVHAVLVLVVAACDRHAQPPRATEGIRIDERPAVAGPSLVLEAEAPAQELGGLSVRFASATHTLGKATRQYASFEVGTRELELSGLEVGDQAEIVEQGRLFVFERLEGPKYRVTLAGTNVTAHPRDHEGGFDEVSHSDCDIRMRVLAHSAGLHHGSWTSRAVSTSGFATLRDETWVGHCGLYTKRVWITARTDDRPDPRDVHRPSQETRQ